MKLAPMLLVLASLAAPCIATGFPPPDASPARHAATGWRADADAMADHALDYLRSQQDKDSGGWAVNPKGPSFPAITALVVSGLIEQAQRDAKDPLADPAIGAGVKYLLSKAQPDGGIYDKLLPSYNTAIAAATLARVNTPEAKAAAANAIEYLKTLQYGEGAIAYTDNPDGAQKVDKSHPFYGGWGYGNHGRPDISNTAYVLEAFHAAGVPESDAAYQRLVFLSRVQMDGSVNDQAYAKGSKQGGFIYATATSKDDAGVGQSYSAGEIEESLDDGTKVSRMRAYGSVTYSGFKSLLYAGLKHDDPRVQACYRWMCQNYTLAENPGMGPAGLYYYYIALARALDAFGADTIPASKPGEPAPSTPASWGEDLTNQLKTLQSADGSFKSVNKRWMEDNGVLITAYSVIALQAAAHQR